MNPKIKKLVGNTGVFAIANMLTKVMMLVLVPIYTYYLSTDEYGVVDTIVTTSSLLLPLATVSIYEAVLRFGMKKNINQQKVLSNAIFMVFITFLILCFIYPFIKNINSINQLDEL